MPLCIPALTLDGAAMEKSFEMDVLRMEALIVPAGDPVSQSGTTLMVESLNG